MENRTTNVKVGIVAASATVLLAASLYYFRDNIRNTFSFSKVTSEVCSEENNTKNNTSDTNNRDDNEGVKSVLGLKTIKEELENTEGKKDTNKKEE